MSKSVFFNSALAALTAGSLHAATPANEPTSGYNTPCRIETQRSCDVFVSGSFTFWQAMQDNMSLGLVGKQNDDDILIDGHVADLDFEFKPGFKLTLGFNLDYDHWDTVIEYTWFRGTDHTKVHLSSDASIKGTFPAQQVPKFLDPRYQRSSESWHLAMDLVDWDLARAGYIGKHLCMRPFIGLRFASIRQDLHVDYANLSASDLSTWPSVSISKSATSWGLGTRLGLVSNWEMGSGCRIYSKGEVDLLFTQYDLHTHQDSETNVADAYKFHQDPNNCLRVHTELALGFGWGTYFKNNRYHIDLSADYGFQVFFNQNMFPQVLNETAVGTTIVPNGDLYVQGLTATLRFDF